MIKKLLAIGMILGLIQGLSSFFPIKDAEGTPRGGVTPKEGKSPRIPPGEIRHFAQKAFRLIELKDQSSRNVALAPPCSVIGISGKKLLLKDFYGRQEAILVEDGKDLRGLKVGDKVVVKDGVLMIGLSPQ